MHWFPHLIGLAPAHACRLVVPNQAPQMPCAKPGDAGIAGGTVKNVREHIPRSRARSAAGRGHQASEVAWGCGLPHPHKGQQALLEEATCLAGALGDGGQQQVLRWPCIGVPLHSAAVCKRPSSTQQPPARMPAVRRQVLSWQHQSASPAKQRHPL